MNILENKQDHIFLSVNKLTFHDYIFYSSQGEEYLPELELLKTWTEY